MPLLMTMILGLLMTQCKKDDYDGEITGVCPLVILTDPADDAVKVALNKMITLTFNENMDPATINTTSFILMEGTNAITGTVTPVSDNKAAFNFTPASPLKPSTLYTGTMKKGVRDPMRNALQKDYVWSFTTIGQHTVALSSSPELGGTTTGDGLYLTDAPASIKAVAATGYTFTNWTEGGKVFTLKTDTTFKIIENRTLVANFATIKYTVALSSNPTIGGTTSGAGSFNSGTSVTVKAVPATGYTFTNWTEGTTIVSTDSDFTFPIKANRALVANFTANPIEYTVALSSNPLLGGTTDGAGSFTSGTSVTVKAVPAVGYTFTNWKEGANIVSTDANFTFPITANRTLVANFTAVPKEYTVALSSNPLLGGTTDGAGLFMSGASVTVKAVPAMGYTFTNWKEGANIVSTNANYMFNITGNRTLVANFTSIAGPIGPIIPNFGGAGDFSILTKSGISSTGITAVQGNIGVSPAAASAITGFGLIMDTNGQSSHTTIATHVTGKVYASDYAPPTPSNLTVAISNMETAYTTANNLVTPAPIVNQGAGNLSGLTLAPGLYKWSTGVKINSGATVTLSGGPNDTWVFQIAQDLTLDPSSQVKLIGGAQAKNIIWVVAGQAVLNTNTVLYGNILSKTLISLNTGSKVTGGLFAQTAVTLNTATVVKP